MTVTNLNKAEAWALLDKTTHEILYVGRTRTELRGMKTPEHTIRRALVTLV